MVKILDRYVMRSFLFSYLVCFFALTGLYVVVESFQVTGKLIREDKEWTDIVITLPRYAAAKTPLFFYQVAPAVNLMAAIFAVTQLSRTNEIVPIKAAGISVYRLVLPIFILALAGAALVMIDQELVIPALRGRIKNIDSQVHDKWRDERRRVLIDDTQGNQIFISYYYVPEKSMYNVDLTQFYEDTGGIRLTAHAKEGFWKRSADGVERWHLSNGTVQAFEKHRPSIVDEKNFMVDGLVLVRTPEEQQDDGRIYVTSDLDYRAIEAAESMDIELMSTSELIARARQGEGTPEVLVSIQRRLSWPLSAVVLLFIGLPFALRSENRAVFPALGMCLVISFAFFLVEMVCRQLGEAGSLSSYLAGWLPTIIFGATGLYLFEKIRT